MQIPQVFEQYDRRTTEPVKAYQYCPRCANELRLAEFGDVPRMVCPRCGFTHFHNPAPSVSVIVQDDERVLLGQRASQPGRGYWAVPSGYIEYPEHFLATAHREIKQETGLEIEIQSIINVASSFYAPEYHFLSIYLQAITIGGSLRAGDDLDAIAWFSLDGPLPELAFEDDRAVLSWIANPGYPCLPVDARFAR